MSASSSATLDGDHNHTARRDKKMSSINGGGDDHHNLPTQDTENPADFPRGDSVGSASIPPKPDLESSYREKQVKVLRSSSFVLPHPCLFLRFPVRASTQQPTTHLVHLEPFI
ncbi:hypothetical protein D9757_006269 [Collybiopsis confluens]|uniref:Uncharacterized protein n=1 Tax=Collybiopsis confluens TaxID=2823264 RepID=A0A8H5HJX2_9AGAR|nr:hypothetical protein D9757_006269 [Collybiopsis confluens]